MPRGPKKDFGGETPDPSQGKFKINARSSTEKELRPEKKGRLCVSEDRRIEIIPNEQDDALKGDVRGFLGERRRFITSRIDHTKSGAADVATRETGLTQSPEGPARRATVQGRVWVLKKGWTLFDSVTSARGHVYWRVLGGETS